MSIKHDPKKVASLHHATHNRNGPLTIRSKMIKGNPRMKVFYRSQKRVCGPTDFSTTRQVLVGHLAWPSFHKFASVQCGVGKCPQWVAGRPFGLSGTCTRRGWKSVGAAAKLLLRFRLWRNQELLRGIGYNCMHWRTPQRTVMVSSSLQLDTMLVFFRVSKIKQWSAEPPSGWGITCSTFKKEMTVLLSSLF